MLTATSLLLSLSLLTKAAFLAVSLRQDNSAGLLARGIESLNGNFNTLGSQRTSVLTSDNQLFSTEAQLSSAAYSVLLSSQIEDTQAALSQVQADLQRERQAFSGANCQGLALCSSCLQRPECVWCAAEERCVAGDDSGPLQGECTDYTRQCDCENAQSCTECLRMDRDCGWCAAYGLCQTQFSQCDYWLQGSCPVSPPIIAQYSAELDAERALTESLREQADLQQQLRLLQDQLTSILQRSPASAPSVQYQPSSTFSDFADTVANTAQNQRKSLFRDSNSTELR